MWYTHLAFKVYPKSSHKGDFFHRLCFSYVTSCRNRYYSRISWVESTRARAGADREAALIWFLCPQSCRKSFWHVEPSEGEVPPGSRLELRVVAHLKDTLHFEDRLDVRIQHGQTHAVPLSATGTGSTIVSDRPFAPSLDLGTHLRLNQSSHSCVKLITIWQY